MKIHTSRYLNYLSLITFCLIGKLYAAEVATPMQPGATTGTPAGAMPPDGLHLSLVTSYEFGSLKKNNGDNAKVAGGKTKFRNVNLVFGAAWVPGWELFGARYSAIVIQPYKFLTTRNTGANGENHTSGMMGTSITPLNLSWDLNNGFFIGTGLAVYIPNGYSDYSRNPVTQKKEAGIDNVSYDFWAFEPNIAITYLKDDWHVTMNNIFNINTTNNDTDYRSGDKYYLDMTVAKRISRQLTLGVIGNWTKQMTDDKISGRSVAGVPGVYSDGRRVEHLLVGPMVSYSFPAFTLTGRFLYNLHTENEPGVSFFHLGISLPIKGL